MILNRSKLVLPHDLLARRLANLINELEPIPCGIRVVKDESVYNAKSLVGMLQAHLSLGDNIVIVTDADDELVHALVVSKFLA